MIWSRISLGMRGEGRLRSILLHKSLFICKSACGRIVILSGGFPLIYEAIWLILLLVAVSEEDGKRQEWSRTPGTRRDSGKDPDSAIRGVNNA